MCCTVRSPLELFQDRRSPALSYDEDPPPPPPQPVQKSGPVVDSSSKLITASGMPLCGSTSVGGEKFRSSIPGEWITP